MSTGAKRVLVVLGVAVLLTASSAAHGHALLHEMVAGETVIVRLSFPGGDQPWFEPYEVFAPGSDTPFQSGRVNSIGEVSFRPDRTGAWRLRVFTEDGHGSVIELNVDAEGTVAAARSRQVHSHGYGSRVLAGVGYLLGIFGVWALWRQRRARAGPG
jgi:nickel transport protein